MSNTNKGQLTSAQRLAKKRMLTQLKREIEDIEYDIKHSKMANLRISTIRNLKISLVVARLIAPYVLTAGITFGAFSIFNVPFVRDDIKKLLETKKTMDSRGNIRTEQQYDEYENTKGTISYIGKWEEGQDGFYCRSIKTYVLKDYSEDMIIKLLEDEDIAALDDIFGTPITSKTELSNNLTEADMMIEPYLEAIVYSKDENDYIIIKEPIDDNLGYGLLWFIVTLFAEMIPITIRSERGTFDFEWEVDKIKDAYPRVNREELKRKLEIRKNNYDRLKR